MNKKLEDTLPGDDEDNQSPFVDPAAKMIGDVKLGKNSFLFPGSVIEGHESKVEVGKDNIIMNNVSVKSTDDHEVRFDDGVFISSGSKIEGCEIGRNTLIGLDAVVLEGVSVGKNSIIGTNAIVPEGMNIPDKKLVLGQPAEIVRDVTDEELEKIESLRSNLMDKRDEFKMIEKRAERFNINSTPQRPKDLWESNKNQLKKNDKEKVPDLDELREKLEKEFDESSLF